MNIFKKIFGTPPLLDAVLKSGDALVFTAEEKSQWALKYLELTSGQNIARRWIALVVTLLWAFMILLAIATFPLAEGVLAKFILELMGDAVLVPFSIIIGFYFATHTVRAAVNGKK